MGRAKRDDENGVGIVRMGPKFWCQHLVIIEPPRHKSSAELDKELKSVMNLDGNNARSPYGAFKELTDSSFFLAMAGKEGMDIRKKLAAAFSPRQFFENSIALTHQHLETLAEAHRIKFYNFIGQLDLLIKKIIAKTLLGADELPDNTGKIFEEIENYMNRGAGAFTPLIPSGFLRFFPQANRIKQNYKNYVQDFLTSIKTPSPLLTETLAEPDKHKREQNIRMLFGLFLAANNISSALSTAVDLMTVGNELYNEVNGLLSFNKNLHKEIEENLAHIRQ